MSAEETLAEDIDRQYRAASANGMYPECKPAPLDLARTLLAAGYVSPEQHARELREVRAEAWAEARTADHTMACRLGLNSDDWGECSCPNPYSPEGRRIVTDCTCLRDEADRIVSNRPGLPDVPADRP